jgi:hypothetical protein
MCQEREKREEKNERKKGHQEHTGTLFSIHAVPLEKS